MKIQVEKNEDKIKVFVVLETKTIDTTIGFVAKYTKEDSEEELAKRILSLQVLVIDAAFKRYQISKLKKLTKKEISTFIENL